MPSAASFYYFVILFCVFSFKFTFIDVGETGIRADDLLIFIAFGLLVFSGQLRNVERSRAVNCYLYFIAISLVSAFWNGYCGRVNFFVAILYVVRLLEYLVFYYLGVLAARSGRTLVLELGLYLGALAAVVPLQMLGILPTTGSFGGITSRAVGNTNGPYELAAVAVFLLYFLWSHPKGRVKGALAFTILLLSASRITFLSTIASSFKALIQQSRLKLRTAVTVAAVFSLMALAYQPSGSGAEQNTGIFDRLMSAASSSLLSDINLVYQEAPTYDTSAEYSEGAFVDAKGAALTTEGDNGEVSGAIRLFRWASLVKSTLEHFDSIIVGLGPSFGTAAVDGYYVRLFIETGILGLASFILFAIAVLSACSKTSWQFREFFLVLLGTCLFIDICVSYKPMLLFWLWHGMNQVDANAETIDINATPPKIVRLRWGSHVLGKLAATF